MSQRGRVLAVFAHPDDESYGPGATLAKLAAEGAEVRLITMTRGERASMGDSPLYSPELLADVRERELECACRALGIARHEVLSFPDGGLAGVTEAELEAPVLKALEEYRPNLVITFHPNGISGHQDHKAVSRTVAEALGPIAPDSAAAEGAPAGPSETAGRGDRTRALRPPRLAYYAIPMSAAALIEWRRIYTVADRDITHAVETGEYLEAKIRAAECHKTQRYLLEKLSAGPGGIETVWKTEHFILRGEAPSAGLERTFQ